MMFIVNRIEPKIGQNGRSRPKNADPCESKALNLQPNIYAPKPVARAITDIRQKVVEEGVWGRVVTPQPVTLPQGGGIHGEAVTREPGSKELGGFGLGR